MLTRVFTCDRCTGQAIERKNERPTGWTRLTSEGPEGGYTWYLCAACTGPLEQMIALLGMIPPKG